MDHSQISTAVMYAYYNNIKQSLTSDDIAGIQSLYGPRQPDVFNSYGHNNGSWTTATDITPYLNGSSNNQVSFANLNLTTSYQTEWLKVTIPSWKGGTMAVQMQSTKLSELSPRLAVFDASLNNGVQAVAPNSYGATVEVDYSVQPNQVYYIRASAANGPTSDTGAPYGLQVNIGVIPLSPIPPPYTTVAAQPDQGGGLEFDKTGHAQEAPIRVGKMTIRGDLLTIGDLGPGSSHAASRSHTAPTAPSSALSGFRALAALTGGDPYVAFAAAGIALPAPPATSQSWPGFVRAWDRALEGW
jgi:hypothetical protein